MATDYKTVDGVHTAQVDLGNDTVHYECTQCRDHADFLPNLAAARKRAHRHTIKTGHRTSVGQVKTYYYERQSGSA